MQAAGYPPQGGGYGPAPAGHAPGGYGAPHWPAPAGGTYGQLELRTSFFFAFWILFLITPHIEINGQLQKRKWGTSTFDLPAGNYRLEVFYPYFVIRRAGRAAMDVRVDPGQCTMARYKAPWFIFLWGGTLKVTGVRAAAQQQVVGR